MKPSTFKIITKDAYAGSAVFVPPFLIIGYLVSFFSTTSGTEGREILMSPWLFLVFVAVCMIVLVILRARILYVRKIFKEGKEIPATITKVRLKSRGGVYVINMKYQWEDREITITAHYTAKSKRSIPRIDQVIELKVLNSRKDGYVIPSFYLGK